MKKSTVTQKQLAEIEKAYNFGVLGYHEGKKAPAQDANVMAMIGKTDASTIDILKAWNNGWHMVHNNETNKKLAEIFAS